MCVNWGLMLANLPSSQQCCNQTPSRSYGRNVVPGIWRWWRCQHHRGWVIQGLLRESKVVCCKQCSTMVAAPIQVHADLECGDPCFFPVLVSTKQTCCDFQLSPEILTVIGKTIPIMKQIQKLGFSTASFAWGWSLKIKFELWTLLRIVCCQNIWSQSWNSRSLAKTGMRRLQFCKYRCWLEVWTSLWLSYLVVSRTVDASRCHSCLNHDDGYTLLYLDGI